MNSSFFDIRPEKLEDAAIITAILDEAFGLDRMTKTSYRLREGSAQAPNLAFVAELDARVVGTIQFWPVSIGGKAEALLLGPLAVLPAMQGFGAGLRLIEHGVAVAAREGHGLVVLVGDAPYYAKAGFRKLEGNVLMPGPFDPDRLLCHELTPGAAEGLDGMILAPHRMADA
ncbi:MAG: N-acetyltransferase [Alphaproteobacteria bacterium]|nr:N-acetyltransferase [Alphaproteobacteria bacterium]